MHKATHGPVLYRVLECGFSRERAGIPTRELRWWKNYAWYVPRWPVTCTGTGVEGLYSLKSQLPHRQSTSATEYLEHRLGFLAAANVKCNGQHRLLSGPSIKREAGPGRSGFGSPHQNKFSFIRIYFLGGLNKY